MQSMDAAGNTVSKEARASQSQLPGAAGPSRLLWGPPVCVPLLLKTPVLEEVRGRLSGGHLSGGEVAFSSPSTPCTCGLRACSSRSSASCFFYPFMPGLPTLRRALPAAQKVLPSFPAPQPATCTLGSRSSRAKTLRCDLLRIRVIDP